MGRRPAAGRVSTDKKLGCNRLEAQRNDCRRRVCIRIVSGPSAGIEGR